MGKLLARLRRWWRKPEPDRRHPTDLRLDPTLGHLGIYRDEHGQTWASYRPELTTNPVPAELGDYLRAVSLMSGYTLESAHCGTQSRAVTPPLTCGPGWVRFDPDGVVRISDDRQTWRDSGSRFEPFVQPGAWRVFQ